MQCVRHQLPVAVVPHRVAADQPVVRVQRLLVLVLEREVQETQHIHRAQGIVHLVQFLSRLVARQLLGQLRPYRIGRIREHALPVRVLLAELHLYNELLPRRFILTKQVKISVFLGNHQTFLLLVDESETGDALARDEQFDDASDEFLVLGTDQNDLESGVIKYAGIFPRLPVGLRRMCHTLSHLRERRRTARRPVARERRHPHPGSTIVQHRVRAMSGRCVPM